MAGFYPYLAATLPSLRFGTAPALSFGRLCAQCKGLIPDEDLAVLESLAQPVSYGKAPSVHPAIAAWVAFDSSLRNELAQARGARLHASADQFLRHAPEYNSSAVQGAQGALKIVSIIDAEMYLDQLRWEYLDSAAFGHYFDLWFLIVYAYKILLLERWEAVRAAKKDVLLEAAVGRQQFS